MPRRSPRRVGRVRTTSRRPQRGPTRSTVRGRNQTFPGGTPRDRYLAVVEARRRATWPWETRPSGPRQYVVSSRQPTAQPSQGSPPSSCMRRRDQKTMQRCLAPPLLHTEPRTAASESRERGGRGAPSACAVASATVYMPIRRAPGPTAKGRTPPHRAPAPLLVRAGPLAKLKRRRLPIQRFFGCSKRAVPARHPRLTF